MISDACYDAHVEYVRGIIPLTAHYIWHVCRLEHPSKAPEFVLDHYVDLWRKTAYSDGVSSPSDPGFSHPRWSAMRRDLCDIYLQCRDDVDSCAFEARCMEYLWPFVEPALHRNAVPPRKGPTRPHGAWTATFRGARVMSLHIANVYRPDSVFDHSEEFATDLLRIIEDTCAEKPCIETVFCGSWMNNLPSFQRFFPPEWVFNLHRPVFHNDTNGIWGQYIRRTGGLHKRNACHLRTRGRHRYPLIHSQCSVKSAVAYLHARGWEIPQYLGI